MRTEIGLFIAFLIGLVFRFLHWPGSGVIIVISLSSISLVYFPGAFYFFSDKVLKRQNLILSIISGLFLATIPMGMLFKLQYWPGANRYLLAGAVSAPIILGVTLFLKAKAGDKLKYYYKR